MGMRWSPSSKLISGLPWSSSCNLSSSPAGVRSTFAADLSLSFSGERALQTSVLSQRQSIRLEECSWGTSWWGTGLNRWPQTRRLPHARPCPRLLLTPPTDIMSSPFRTAPHQPYPFAIPFNYNIGLCTISVPCKMMRGQAVCLTMANGRSNNSPKK